MKFTQPIFVVLGIAMLLGACASEQTVTKTQVKKDAWGKDERYSVGKDKDGNPMMKSDRRSSMEGKGSNMASNRDFNGEDYSTKSYRKNAGVVIPFLVGRNTQATQMLVSIKKSLGLFRNKRVPTVRNPVPMGKTTR